MRRITENIMVSLPAGFLLFIPILFGLNHIYRGRTRRCRRKTRSLKSKSGLAEPDAFS